MLAGREHPYSTVCAIELHLGSLFVLPYGIVSSQTTVITEKKRLSRFPVLYVGTQSTIFIHQCMRKPRARTASRTAASVCESPVAFLVMSHPARVHERHHIRRSVCRGGDAEGW